MAKKQSIVEEAIIQMKDLENVIAENAKGILASTMKQEISELVKESLKKSEEESEESKEEMDEQEMDMDSDEMEDDEMSFDDEESDDVEMDMDVDSEMDMDTDMDMDMSDDDSYVDLTNASDDELIKVFKAMGDEDGIIVKKDGNTIDLDDQNADEHYKISLGEQEEDESYEETDEEMDEELDEEWSESSETDEEMDEELDEEWSESSEMDEEMDEDWSEVDIESSENPYKYGQEDDELMFEIEMDEEMDEELDEEMDEVAEKMETKEGFKPKGVGMGKAKFTYGKQKGGFKEDMKQGKTVGTGKAKFEYKEAKKMDMKPVKKGGETSEASRTLGSGKYFGKKGLPKPKAAPQHLKVESVDKEVKILRERNEEYRKALNVFKTKLNEVAIFNSNLAYATRLFTEHSTTKQEKINILRRFDSVETIKESKALYKTIKNELSNESKGKVVKESIQEKIEKTPVSGSAINLIESKTYENPQFMRMKDLMTKMNVIK